MPSSIADTIRNRRTIHQFEVGRTPSPELIRQAIEHALCAPNHYLTRPWHFHLIGPETAERICQLNAELVKEAKGDKAAGLKLRRWREIPGWLLLSCDMSEDAVRSEENYAACCCVAQNLSLYLWEEGIGMKWTTGAVTRDRRFFEIVGLDLLQHKIVGLFWYGYPAEVPQATRPPAAESITTLP